MLNTGPRKFIAVVVFGTMLLWAMLVFRIPLLQKLPGWVWEFTNKPGLFWWALVGAIFCFGLVVAGILHQKFSDLTGVALLVLVGVLLQFGFAAIEGRGITAVSDRLLTTGHAEFADLAVVYDDIPLLIASYEELVDKGKLGKFAPSKPPGTLIFHILTNRLSRVLHPGQTHDRALADLRTTAAWLWPLLSCLVLVPLFFLGRSLYGREPTLLACALFLTVPSVNLINLHTDQVIYPLFFVSCVALGLWAGRRDSWWLGVAGGVLAYLTMGLSFGLGSVLVIMVVSCRSSVRANAGLTAGLILSVLVGCLWLHYPVWNRFLAAVSYHQTWRPWPSSWWAPAYLGLLNMVEFGIWLGIPLTCLSVYGWAGEVKTCWSAKTDSSRQSTIVFVLILLLAFFTRTQGETARLWLFLVPFVCLVAAKWVCGRPINERAWLIWLVVFLQLGTTLLIKLNMDFA